MTAAEALFAPQEFLFLLGPGTLIYGPPSRVSAGHESQATASIDLYIHISHIAKFICALFDRWSLTIHVQGAENLMEIWNLNAYGQNMHISIKVSRHNSILIARFMSELGMLPSLNFWF